MVNAEVFFYGFQILETAFKKETVGLVTREEYVEKVILFLNSYSCRLKLVNTFSLIF
jgi:hypothetical protein